MTLKARVSGVVKFVEFCNTDKKQELIYVCEDGFKFPVPLADTAGADFQAEDKGLFFMRWIRKHMALVETAKAE
jgi:hypothetical protein